jgi:hypothetical protein
MTFRHHLLIDSIIQALLIVFFSFLLTRSSVPLNILQLMPITLFGWQFINAVFSYKFFERTSKKLFVRISGYCLLFFFALRGILYFGSKFTSLMQMANELTIQIEPIILLVLPFFCTALALWYLYITFRDLYNMIYNTI